MNQDHLLLKPSSSDRSASLDASDNLASLPVSSPALSTAKGGLNKLPIPSSRQTPFKNLTNQDSLRSILSRQNFSIRSPSLFQTAESATKPIFLNDLKYFTEANTSRKRHERTKSDHPNKENYERSFGLTVQEAYDLQFEKENEFMKEKVALEKGIIAETNLLQQVIKAIEVDVNNKEKTLVALDETMAQLEKIEMKSLERDDPIWFDLPLSLTDFEQAFKGLTTATRSLRETLQKMANEASEHKKKVGIQEAERELGVLTEKISILVHKLTEIEDKKMQVKECEQMVEEDIYSYEVALAESTFIHEEASAVIDALKLKDSDAFENAKKEIVLDRRFFELEVELQQKEESIQKELQILAWNEREADNLLREIKEGSIEISIAIEKEKVLDREMFDPKNNLYSKMQVAMRSISPGVNWGELLSFFKIFELGLEMEPYDKNRVIMYQNDLLEEILYVIRQTQAIESLESMTIVKPRVSVTNRGERRYSKVLESISSNKEVQNEIVNKKLDLNEKLAIFNEKKSKSMEMIENNIRRKYDFIRYCETSFYDIIKKIDPKLKKVTEDTIIEIVSRAEATWKAYISLSKDINERQTELQSLEEDLERIRKAIKDYEASIDSYKREGELKRKEIDTVLGQLNILQEKHLAIEMREKDEDLLSITSEKLLEREQVQTRRGDALVKLKKDFGAIENKIRDWRKMKKDMIESEDLINNLESYMTKIEQNVENDLKVSLKKSKGQVAEFKLKAAIAQRDLLEVLEQEEEIIKKFEHMVYSKSEENRERTILVFVDSIECRGFLSELIKEIRGKILKGFVKNLLQGVELSCIEMSEIQKIKEQVEQIEAEQYKNQGLNHTTILQNELKKIQNSIQEKKSQLITGEKEAEKYRHFYEVSNELLKSRTPSVAQSPAMSILSPSMRSPLEISKIKPISPIPSQTSLLKNVLDSSKISTKRDSHTGTGVTQSKHRKTNSSIQHCFKHESERRPAFMTPMTPITPIASTDLQLDSHWLKETEPMSLESLSGKSQSTSGNGQSTHTKSNDSDKQLNVEYGRPTEGRLSCVARMEKIPKLLEVSEEELHMLISQFEAGFVVYKRFSESNKVEERVTVCLSIKGKTKPKTDLIGYGKRIFRLNIKERTIEVIKIGPGSRNTVECKYDWSSLKKVLLPQKTLEALKERHLQSPRKIDDVKEEAFGLKLSMDVVNKGRIDLLMWNIWHVITLWNIVNKALAPGNMFSTVKK